MSGVVKDMALVPKRDVVLVDLSSIAHPIWHMSGSDPDPNAASQKIVARVRSLASSQPHVAICCDKGKSFRHELSPTYKANRPESDATLHHQITLAREILEADGFPVWAVTGFEADDLIASATAQALQDDATTVTIISADKDLLQLVGDRVRAINVRDGSIVDAAAVQAKFGVTPAQMRDYLCLVGDASDNVKGAKGIGAVKAAELLTRFGSVEAMFSDMLEVGVVALKLTPALVTNLKEFAGFYPDTRQLITLRTDAELPFDQLFEPRRPKEIESLGFDLGDDAMMDAQPTTDLPIAPDANQDATPAAPVNVAAMTVQEPDVLPAAPAEWERQLDPRSMREARIVAKDMFDSRMFSAYGTPQGVLSTVMVGRELGMPAMASLRSIHVIEGRHALAASLMVALILRSGLAEYFDPVSFSEKEATYETKRKGARNAVTLTHTIEMAQAAGLVKDKSGWTKNPTDMLVARATARLARMVYPDLLAGLYTPEELEDIRQSVA